MGAPVDVVLTGGKVWTGVSAGGQASEPTAIAILAQRIVAVGDDESVLERAGPETQHVDLAGRRVVPGFIDNHTHFIEGGFALASVQLRDADTPEEFIRRIGESASQRPNEWITGGSWDHERWGGELPRRDWIDSVTGSTPVFVSRLDLHMGLANSRALELAGITAEMAAPPGGEIERYSDGSPTGVLKDAAQNLIFSTMPPRSEGMLDRALQSAARHAVERGVTMITDMGTIAGLRTYQRARQRGELPLRAYAVVPIAEWEELAAIVAGEGRGDERLYWGGTKGFVDGSLGSTTAWFYEPYLDEPGETGLMVTDTAVLREQILSADRAGLHVIVHAIGDRANDWLLDAFAGAKQENGDHERRFRIEHFQHVRPQTVARAAADRVIVSMQPYHAIDDGRWAMNRIGPERILTTYAFRDIIDANGILVFGSDWTVAPIDPLLGIYAAVTRRTLDGANPDGWVPSQRITVEEAVRAYTVTNAYASYLENDLGTIEVGKLADLVVLSQDIFSIDPVEIENTRVDMTMMNGEFVFSR
jgi:hypothetical protein